MKNIALLTLILTLSTQFFFACSERLNLDYARKTASICTVACITPTTYGALAGAAGKSYVTIGSIGICGCAACAIATTIIYLKKFNNVPQQAPHLNIPPTQIQMRITPSQPLSEDPRNP